MQYKYSYTIPEYAERHSVSKATVFRWLKSGKLDSLKIGHLRRITIEDESAFLAKYHVSNSGGQNHD